MDFLTVVNPYFPDVTLLAYVFRVLLVGPLYDKESRFIIAGFDQDGTENTQYYGVPFNGGTMKEIVHHENTRNPASIIQGIYNSKNPAIHGKSDVAGFLPFDPACWQRYGDLIPFK
ncbi:hypothetical protein SRABI96_00887 [Peribacillus sp. Bi96]|uniref:hypothetical protein n=1 Tax=Peribacillus sp. Bi96 TaxID=2884273 RepID=UPI001D5EE5A0|nr:hypothetical protein [Peribacillus sp. Bi96]CAH0158139.1 hypothetical protein SRABI96_00887 [Peribacillus sp. Bi96]